MKDHVAIVGAGVVGLSTAYDLLNRGFRVTILEKDAQECEGCSFGNGGLIVPSHFVPLAAPGMVMMGLRMLADRRSPFGVERITDFQTLSWMARFALAGTKAHVERCAPLLRDLNLASWGLYERMIAEMGVDVGFARKGLLMLSRTPAAHRAEAKLGEEANRLGLRTTDLSPKDLQSLEPQLEMDVAGAVLFEDDAHLTPSTFMRALRAHVVAQGARLLAGDAMTKFRTEGWRVASIVHQAGELQADHYVLAAGAWSGELAATFRLRLPMLAGRGYGITATNPPQRPRIPAIFTEARVAVTPMQEGVHFVGTMELSHPVVRPTSPRVEAMRENVSRYYPAYKPADLDGTTWCGLRPCSPDGMPYIGRSRRAENLVIATGHAMMGMSLGPVTGKLVGELIADEKPSHPLDLLSPDRYA
ncbi:FAD-binding oxidoreductase [soil metagenome]